MDETIQYAVQGKEWATPFMNYLVHILKEGKGLRKLPAPAAVMEYSEEYRNENDGIARFVSEKLVPIAEGDEIVPIDKTTLRRVFKQWSSDNELRLAPNEMEKRVEVTYGKFHKGGWTNFKIELSKVSFKDRNLIQIFTCASKSSCGACGSYESCARGGLP
jgi:phage/plasmid-associated DNA primase